MIDSDNFAQVTPLEHPHILNRYDAPERRIASFMTVSDLEPSR